MGNVVAMFEIFGDPRTKKNSQRVVRFGGHYAIRPSKAFEDYQKSCLKQIVWGGAPISFPVNARYMFYMQTHRKVDLPNLEGSLDDILIKAGVYEDDNSNIIVGHDGSRVLYDKQRPRVEVFITNITTEE